jgi:hypothetical protein
MQNSTMSYTFYPQVAMLISVTSEETKAKYTKLVLITDSSKKSKEAFLTIIHSKAKTKIFKE